MLQPFYRVDIPVAENSARSTIALPPLPSFVPSIRLRRDIHSVKKKFICNKCGNYYAFVQSLNRHKKWECGKKPGFRCPYCTYTSKQPNHAKEHVIRKHPGKAVHILNLAQE